MRARCSSTLAMLRQESPDCVVHVTREFCSVAGHRAHLRTSGGPLVFDSSEPSAGRFLLRDRLVKQLPKYRDEKVAIYAAIEKIPEIDIAKLMHFAIGIYFKAAVHSWLASTDEP